MIDVTRYSKCVIDNLLQGEPMPSEDNPTLLSTGAKLYSIKGKLIVMGYARDLSDETRAVKKALVTY